MSRSTNDPAADFAQLARQYWSAWSDAAGKSPPGDGIPGWKDGLAWWSRLAAQGGGDVESALERMNAQAGHWFGAMQQLAAGMAGRDAAPTDIVQGWRELLGASGGNPLADMFTRMGGREAQGIDAWMAQAAPYLSGMRGEARAWLHLPTFGLAREHQERLQQLAQAQLDYQERNHDYNALLARAGQDAFARFERKLAEHSEPGRQIESARALFDLWIDAAEEAWAAVALTTEYRSTYGRLVNAQMLLRSRLQREIEVAAGMFGLPTRSELDASHRKLAALEREVRALKAATRAAPRAVVTAADRAPPAARESVAAKTAPAPAKRTAKRPPRAATRKLAVAHVAPPQAVTRNAKPAKSKPRPTRSTGKGR
jgi:hypothetical protein